MSSTDISARGLDAESAAWIQALSAASPDREAGGAIGGEGIAAS